MKSCSLQNNFSVWASPLWKSFTAIPYHWWFLLQHKKLQRWLGFLPELLCWLTPVLSFIILLLWLCFSGEGEEQMQFLRKTDTYFAAFCVQPRAIFSCLLCVCLMFWVCLYISRTVYKSRSSPLGLGPIISNKWWYDGDTRLAKVQPSEGIYLFLVRLCSMEGSSVSPSVPESTDKSWQKTSWWHSIPPSFFCRWELLCQQLCPLSESSNMRVGRKNPSYCWNGLRLLSRL